MLLCNSDAFSVTPTSTSMRTLRSMPLETTPTHSLIQMSASNVVATASGEIQTNSNSKDNDNDDGSTAVKKEERPKQNSEKKELRPLHQNWWPVSVVSALDKSRPNAIELLGMKLVLFYDQETEEWQCLEDMCAHRFAPLSEGRIVVQAVQPQLLQPDDKDGKTDEDDVKGKGKGNNSNANGNGNGTKCGGKTKTCIQCAYHGWEFDKQGSCTLLPQLENNNPNGRSKVKPVQSFPVQLDVGMVWVWADSNPETTDMSTAIDLPVSPLLRRHHREYGDECGFMRDLPYGMELLAENLLDLSHLPFSHHSVGSLNRDLGCPLPLKMLSQAEKVRLTELEYDASGASKINTDVDVDVDADLNLNMNMVVPRFQAEVVNASLHDPMFLSLQAMKLPVAENSTCTIAYYDPCHIRYRRDRSSSVGHVELFMTPIGPGKSRAYIFNVFDGLLPPLKNDNDDIPGSKPKATFKSRMAAVSPAALKAKLQKKIMKKLFHPVSVKSHMASQQILDGDGIFLNKQGDRMRRNNLSYRDYSTPTSADILLNAYRRYLDLVVKKTEESGHTLAASSCSSSYSDSDTGVYVDNDDRSTLLDRYNSHTKNCRVCSESLAKSKRWHGRWDTMQTAFVGAMGGSATVFASAAVVALMSASVSASVPAVLLPASGVASISTSLGAVIASRKKKKLDATIKQFYFEDYVHAEKD